MRRIILIILLMLFMLQALPDTKFSDMDLSQSDILFFKLSAIQDSFSLKFKNRRAFTAYFFP